MYIYNVEYGAVLENRHQYQKLMSAFVVPDCDLSV